MPSTPVFRPSARLVVRDSLDRILLFSGADEDGTYWFTPGGGMKDDESPAAAAVRELAEETGYVLTEAEAGPVVATCAGQWLGYDGTRFFGADSFFFVTVNDPAVCTDGQEDLERSLITGHRWWKAGELQDTPDAVLPPGLPGLVAQLLASGVPDWPLRLPWHSSLPVRPGRGRARVPGQGTGPGAGHGSRGRARVPGQGTDPGPGPRVGHGPRSRSPGRGQSPGDRYGSVDWETGRSAQEVTVARKVPSGAAWKTGTSGPMSRTAAMSSASGSASPTSAAASSRSAPLDTAIATASRSADSRSDGSATVAAV